MLEGANIKLSGTVSDILGKSGRALLEATISQVGLCAGEIAAMRDAGIVSKRIRATDERLAQDMDGILSGAQRRIVRELLDHIDELDAHIVRLDADIDENLGADQV